jgi:hypothetical protein
MIGEAVTGIFGNRFLVVGGVDNLDFQFRRSPARFERLHDKWSGSLASKM